MYLSSEGIALKSSDFREADKLVTVFTEKQGKIRAIARGTRKPKSSLRACIQPFCLSLLYFSSDKDLGLITQGKLIDFFGNCREDLHRTLYCTYIMELLDKCLLEKMALPALFNSTRQVLEYLNEKGYSPIIIRYFEMRLLMELGYRPTLDHCITCLATDQRLTSFSLPEGGTLCSDCAAHHHQQIPLTGELLAILRLLMAKDLAVVSRLRVAAVTEKQMENFLERYMRYHLETRANLKKTIAFFQTILPDRQ
ncbi:MAG: DNA repair protein RecO [Syntrophomonadaceae bacterium]